MYWHQRIAVVCLFSLAVTSSSVAAEGRDDDLRKIGGKRGIVGYIGAPQDLQRLVEIAKASELTVYCQTASAENARALRESAARAGLLATRIFVAEGALSHLHLADNVADCLFVSKAAADQASDSELVRVLRPRAFAYSGSRRLSKAVPKGVDDWSHPYHGPDNNPQSHNELVRGEFRTQFLGYPMFSPMPEQSVIANGRIYKAMGHIAHKANQNAMLNKLVCINAYNGTILWQRELPKGFMIHRNTMIAVADGLWMGDHESCKFIAARSGKVEKEIRVPQGISDGPVWKWMALQDGVLYALVGNLEVSVETQKSIRRGLGHWPWGMWKGHDYKDPRTAFGFGRTLMAVDLKTQKVLWHYRNDEFIDARGVCMNDQQIFAFSPPAPNSKDRGFLLGIDRATGKQRWKNSDKDLLAAIAPNAKAQHFITGYATSCYIKCNQERVFFSGPQRPKMVVASAKDGKLEWTHPTGNLQIVLRDDGVWAAGSQRSKNGMRLDYRSGKVLAEFPARRACTRATGCADSVFFRASGGTVRVLTDSVTAQHIAPMRPPCQDGVLIAGGHLYWGPWMCGCQLSLYGNIGLAPATAATRPAKSQPALLVASGAKAVKPFPLHSQDWTAYRGNNSRNDQTEVAIPEAVKLRWKIDLAKTALPTAPVAAGGRVFVADRTGAVSSFDDRGKLIWKAYTGGAVYYPPALAHDRVYVGSADGRVYAYEAASGRFLWSHRVAPRDRLIPAYGKLVSTWPVAGGVVVEGDTVYAAAGIAHYDGTHVVALNAFNGSLRARNDSSGALSEQVNSGISMQGNLKIVNKELRFLAGGVYEIARYDLKSLKCLNKPRVQVRSQFRTAFYPFYPGYAKFVSLDHTLEDGCTLTHDASYEGSRFISLALLEALPPGVKRPRKDAARWARRRGKKGPQKLWQDKTSRRFTSFVVSPKTLLACGHPAANPNKPSLVATDPKTGKPRWTQTLPADAVKGGVAIDHRQLIYVSLENGQLWCFAAEKKKKQ